ncbi:distal tail protein Dit [Peptoniphilaceae bacterium SGI.097]
MFNIKFGESSDGLILDTTIPELGKLIYVESIRRPYTADISNHLIDVPGKDGSIYRNTRLGSKTIEVDLRLIAESGFYSSDVELLNEAFDFLKPILVKKSVQKLWLSDRPKIYEMAILDNVAFERVRTTASMTLSFLCPYGVSFGIEEQMALQYNQGTAPTPVHMQGTAQTGGTVSFAYLDNDQPKAKITLVDVAQGAKIEVDTEQETVEINGVLAMDHVDFTSDFFWLMPGALSEIEISGVIGFEVRFRERYL